MRRVEQDVGRAELRGELQVLVGGDVELSEAWSHACLPEPVSRT